MRWLLISALMAVLACDVPQGGSGGSRAGTVSDSAGIRLVAHDLMDVASVRTLPLDSTATVSLSGEVHEFLDNVRAIEGGVLLPDDRIALALRGEQQIALIGTDGNLIRTIGRKGAGPGEFEQLKGPWLSRNELVTFDRSQRRLTRFDTSGKLVSSDMYLEQSTGDTVQMLASVIGILQNGRAIGSSISLGRPVPGLSRQQVQMTALDSGGVTTHLSGGLPGAEMSVIASGPGRFGLRQPPFGRNTLMAVCPNSLLHMESHSGRLVAQDESGATTQMLDLRTNAVKIERAHFVAEAMRNAGGDSSVLESAVAIMQEMTATENLPIAMSLKCMRDGNIWVQLFPLPSDSMTTHVLFDAEFALLGRVVLPRTHVVLDASRGKLLLARPGDDDVAVVEVRRIRVP